MERKFVAWHTLTQRPGQRVGSESRVCTQRCQWTDRDGGTGSTDVAVEVERLSDRLEFVLGRLDAARQD